MCAVSIPFVTLPRQPKTSFGDAQCVPGRGPVYHVLQGRFETCFSTSDSMPAPNGVQSHGDTSGLVDYRPSNDCQRAMVTAIMSICDCPRTTDIERTLPLIAYPSVANGSGADSRAILATVLNAIDVSSGSCP